MTRLAPLLALLLTGCTSAIQDGLVMNDVITVGESFTSSFLLPTQEGAVLFDAGLADAAGPILDALEAIELGPGDVTDVFLTHGHGDHTGGVAVFENARLRAVAAEQAVLDEEESGLTIDAPVAEGDIVEIGGRAIEVFHIPGHTPGSAAYLVSGVLILGDSALLNARGRLEQPPERFSDDLDQLDRSLFRLRDAVRARPGDVAWLACSHSGPGEGPDALLAYGGR